MVEESKPVPVEPKAAPIQAPNGLTIRWPTNPSSWAGLIILAICVAWLANNKQYEAAAILFGLLLSQLGISGQSAAALAFAFRAAEHASQAANTAADAAAQTDAKLNVALEAVKDIQDNPAQPGTPGWMERNAPPP